MLSDLPPATDDMPERESSGELSDSDAEALRRLVAGAAHDLNNLLVVVTGCAELALDDGSLSPRTRELVGQILDVAGRARTLSTRCLLIGHPGEPSAAVDLVGLVLSSRGVLGRLVGDGVEVQIESDGAPILVHADPSQLEQVIFNLAVNAREAMPAGGRLTMAVTTAELRIDLGSGAPPRRVARLIVSDTGRGIDPSVRERMFEPHVTTKAAAFGTSGLGLSVVRAVVDRLGGDIDVLSAPGVGTTFVIDLPRASGAADR